MRQTNGPTLLIVEQPLWSSEETLRTRKEEREKEERKKEKEKAYKKNENGKERK